MKMLSSSGGMKWLGTGVCFAVALGLAAPAMAQRVISHTTTAPTDPVLVGEGGGEFEMTVTLVETTTGPEELNAIGISVEIPDGWELKVVEGGVPGTFEPVAAAMPPNPVLQVGAPDPFIDEDTGQPFPILSPLEFFWNDLSMFPLSDTQDVTVTFTIVVPEGEDEAPFDITSQVEYRFESTAILDTAITDTVTIESDVDPFHSADTNDDNMISVQEISRVVTFFNAVGYEAVPAEDPPTTDGFRPITDPGSFPGNTEESHDSDFNPTDFEISVQEISRLVTFFNASGGYERVPAEDPPTADGFRPVTAK